MDWMGQTDERSPSAVGGRQKGALGWISGWGNAETTTVMLRCRRGELQGYADVQGISVFGARRIERLGQGAGCFRDGTDVRLEPRLQTQRLGTDQTR